MEAEVVRMACTLFNGGPDSCGVVSNLEAEFVPLKRMNFPNLTFHTSFSTTCTEIIPVCSVRPFLH